MESHNIMLLRFAVPRATSEGMAKKAAGRRLREWMAGDGDRPASSQADIAKMLGVTQQAVSQWVAGERTPGLVHMRELERLTGIVAWDWIQPGGEK